MITIKKYLNLRHKRIIFHIVFAFRILDIYIFALERFYHLYHREDRDMTNVTIWDGWIGGIAVGAYLLVQLILSGKLLGVSTGFGNVCSIVSRNLFFHTGDYETVNNWRLWFILGIPLGGLLAAVTSGGHIFASFSMGPMYDSVLPQALWLKGLVLVLGGILIGYGSRLAGGCTSGHSISGMALLNPPSILASAGFFAGGIIIVQIMFNLL